MAVVILVTGLMLGAAAIMVTPVIRRARQLETQAKLENIARAIDYYAAQNFRVPCPSSPGARSKNPPFGYEQGSGPDGNLVPADCGPDPKKWEGAVPFRTLNIPADWIRDAAGDYITYAISPAFSQDVSQAALPVHSRCRTAEWFTGALAYENSLTDPRTGKPPANVPLPKDDRKARFCCSGALPGTDLVILDVNRAPQIAVSRQASSASYAPASVTFPDPFAANVPVPQDDRATAPVYVLVSHGHDGHGSFTGSGLARRSLSGATPAEIENANGDRTFVEIPPAGRAGTEMTFDDMVLWRTQDMIFAGQGKSCSIP